MTTTERLKRIGSQELKKRLGPNLVRGLIASVFIHGAIVSMGLFDWGDHEPRVKYRRIPPSHPHKPPPHEREPQDLPPRLKRPVLPEIEIPKPTEQEPEFVEDVPEETIDKNMLLQGKYGETSDDSLTEENQDGWGSDGDLLADLEIKTAGPEMPVYIFREIDPVPLSTNPYPEYPSIAALSGVTATVRVWVFVGIDGTVQKSIIIDTTAPGLGFEEAVAEVIDKWKFTPAIQGNAPIAVWVNIPFSFKIKN